MSNVAQGAYGEALLCAVAAAAGISYGRLTPDPGTDVVLESPLTGEMASIQVKTVSTPAFGDGCLKYPLEVDAYEKLRLMTTTRRYLVVFVVPPLGAHRISSMTWGYVMRQQGYYLSLRGAADTVNAHTQTVSLPLANVVNKSTIVAITEGEV